VTLFLGRGLPIHKPMARWKSRTLLILTCAAMGFVTASGNTVNQNPPASDNAVQAQIRNVTFRFSDTVAIQIRSMDGELAPLGKNEFPNFDDKNSFNLRINSAEISIDPTNLANVMNTYVFARPDSPLSDLSITVVKGRLNVKGKLHNKGNISFESEGALVPTPDGKLRLHSDKVKAMHIPVKGLMDLLGIEFGGLVKEGKVPGVVSEGDDMIFDLEQMLPPPHIEGKVTSVRVEGDKIIQVFGGADAKPVKNVRTGNYMAFKNNRIHFGKLMMNDTDLTLIDMDPADPFDFYLDHYKDQLAAGYVKVAPDGGLHAYLKDHNKMHPPKPPAGAANVKPK
jgi:hypothetical protein